MKSKFIKLITFALLTTLTLLGVLQISGCGREEKANHPFAYPCEYDISFQLNEAKGTAKLTFDAEGNLNVLYGDAESIFFGMTEEVRGDSVRLLYHNIEWRGCAEQSNAGKIKRIFDILNTSALKSSEEETLNHIDCKKYTIFTQDEIISLWAKKEDGTPLRIIGEFSDGKCEINF